MGSATEGPRASPPGTAASPSRASPAKRVTLSEVASVQTGTGEVVTTPLRAGGDVTATETASAGTTGKLSMADRLRMEVESASPEARATKLLHVRARCHAPLVPTCPSSVTVVLSV